MEQTAQNTNIGADTTAQIPGTTAQIPGADTTGADAVGAATTNAQIPAADAAAVAAAPTAPAKEPKKTEKCEAIFLEMVAQKKTRQEILTAFKDKVSMTPDGAGTYYANLVKKHGITGEKSVRAAKAAPTTAAGDTAAAPKTPKATKPRPTKTGGTTAVGGDKAVPTFAIVTLANGQVSAVQPVFSQLSAVRGAGAGDGAQVAVQGVPNIGDAEASLVRLDTTK